MKKTASENYQVRQTGKRKAQQLYHEGSHPNNANTQELMAQFTDVIADLSGHTQVIYHIFTEQEQTLSQRPYQIPEAKRTAVREKLRKMLEMGIIEESNIEESNSPWSISIVYNGKDLMGLLGFVMILERLTRFLNFQFMSTLDFIGWLLEGPTHSRREGEVAKHSCTTLEDFYQYKVLPFRLHRAPAPFHRMMDKIIRPHQQYGSYLDGVGSTGMKTSNTCQPY